MFILCDANCGSISYLFYFHVGEYLEVHSKPGWTLLKQYADIDPMEMAKSIKQKLYGSKL